MKAIPFFDLYVGLGCLEASVILFDWKGEGEPCLLSCTIWNECAITEGELEMNERFTFNAN